MISDLFAKLFVVGRAQGSLKRPLRLGWLLQTLVRQAKVEVSGGIIPVECDGPLQDRQRGVCLL